MDAANPVVLDHSHEFFLHPSDHPSSSLASEHLTGSNYSQWKRSCEVSLVSKNKLGFVNGGCAKPATGPLVSQWERRNAMVISWLLHSIRKDIATSVLFCSTAKQIWEELELRYGQSQGTKIFQVQRDNLSQGSSSISEYFTKCTILWDEYAALVTIPTCPHADCPVGTATYKLLENQQLIQFLMGLNDVYIVVRGDILMSHPMPQIGQALSMVLQEERQRELQSSAPLLADSSAFLSQHKINNNFPPRQFSATTNSQPHTSLANPSSTSRRNTLFCNYCKKSGHTIDKCYSLQRKRNTSGPTDRSSRVAANVTLHPEEHTASTHSASVPTFTHDQYNKLLAMLSKHELETSVQSPGESAGTAMLAGKVFCFSVSNPSSKWIIDSGATDHITPDLKYFSSYSPLPCDSFIIMPNGKHARIHNIGTIQLTPTLTLSNALHVPAFHYNLLSASKLAKQLQAHVVFTPSHCYLQVPSTRQPLGIGKELGGLYLVDHQRYQHSLADSSAPSYSKNAVFSCHMSSLELWHCRLGHMSFQNMKHIDVVKHCNSLPHSICQVCHNAKQHRDPFPVSLSCTTHLFELIHIDLWGPYPHPTYSGYKYFLTIVDDYSRATWTHLLATKSNAFPIFKSFVAFV